MRVFLSATILPALFAVMAGRAICACPPRTDIPQIGDTFTPGTAQSADLSSDSKKVGASIDDGSVVMWDLRTGKKTTLLDCIPSSVQAMQFRPGTYELAIGDGEGNIHFVSPSTAGEDSKLKVGDDFVSALAFDPGGRILAVEVNGRPEVALWDSRKKSALANLGPCEAPDGAIAFSRTSPLLAAKCAETDLRVWNLQTHSVVAEFKLPKGNWINECAFGADDATILVATGHGEIDIFELAGRTLSRSLEGHSDQVVALRLIGNDELLSRDEDGKVRFWDLKTGTAKKTLKSLRGANQKESLLYLEQVDDITSAWIAVRNLKTGKVIRKLQ